MIMKKLSTIVAIVCCTTIMISCNGRTARETERVVGKIYREYKAMTESDAYRYYQMQRRINTFNELRENLSKCSTCSGYGIVYRVDDYGNYYGQYDGYGNFYPTIYTCPACGGSGRD